MESKQTFGEYLNLKRKEALITRKQLADKLNVSDSEITKWEDDESYPSITLIKSLCEILNITEQDLISRCDNREKNTDAVDAKKFRTIKKVYIYIWTILYGIALLTCFIVNLAVDKTLSWFFIVFGALLLAASLTLVPVLVKRKKGLITLGAFFGALNLLLLICNIYTSGNWFLITFVALLFSFSIIFMPIIINQINFEKVLNRLSLPNSLVNHKTLIIFIFDTVLLYLLLGVSAIYNNSQVFFSTTLPVTTYVLIFPWAMMLVIRYMKVDRMFKLSFCFFLVSILVYFTNPIIMMFVDKRPIVFDQFNLFDWSDQYLNGNLSVINALTFFLIAIVFAVGGMIKTKVESK